MYLLSARHAAIPDSCVRYVAAMVDDVITTGSEVLLNMDYSLQLNFEQFFNRC